MSSILERLKKNSKIKETAVIEQSTFFGVKDVAPTDVPMLNVALSGEVDGGVTSGLHILAGPSKHFKTSFALVMAKAYLDKHKDSVILFYDSEFGSPKEYFQTFGIDTNRVMHTPVKNVEELKFDMIAQLEGITRKDKVIIVVDSIGNLASKKEIEDAQNEKSVADMSRAKQLKSLFRMVTPYLTMNEIPMIAINHTYAEISLFPRQIVSGGTGLYYSANSIFIIGRAQEKVGTEITGYHFKIKIEKSRFVKEASTIPISVMFDGGIMKYSGLFEEALDAGLIVKPKNGWYSIVDVETGEIEEKCHRAKAFVTKDMWIDNGLLERLKPKLRDKFKLVHTNAISDDEVDAEFEQAVANGE